MQFIYAKVNRNTKKFWTEIFKSEILPVIDHWKLHQLQHIFSYKCIFLQRCEISSLCDDFRPSPRLKSKGRAAPYTHTLKTATASVDTYEEKRSNSPIDVTNTDDESASELLCGK